VVASFPSSTANLYLSSIPSAIPTEQNILSDDPQIGEKFLAEFGETTYLGGGQYSYSTIMGVRNIWNGTEWVPWIYSQENKSLRIGEVTLTHLSDGALMLEGESGVIIGRLSWYTQYYLAGSWHNVTLDNYAFRGIEFTENTVTAKQQFWSNSGELNVTYLYTKNSEFKITVDVTNNAAISVPIRIFWVAAEIKNIVGNYEMIQQEFDGVNITIGIDIDGLKLTWLDVQNMDPNLAVNTVVDKPNRRAAVIFGDTSRSLGVGQTYTLDPSVNPVIGADEDDDWWRLDTNTHYTTSDEIYVYTDGSLNYTGQIRFPLAIPQGATIDSANLTMYETLDSTVRTGSIIRIDETNVGALEADSSLPAVDGSETITYPWDASGAEWQLVTITSLVQTQIDLGGWASGYYIGFRFFFDYVATGNHRFEDYQAAATHHTYLNVTYTEAGGEAYEKNLTESVSAVDVIVTAADMARVLVESIGVVGAITMLRGREQDLVETISASDVKTTAAAYARNFTESITASEAMTRAADYALALVESIAVVDGIDAVKNAGINYEKDLTESIGVSIDLTTVGGTVVTIVTTSMLYQLFFSVDMWGYLGPLAIVVAGYVCAKKDKGLGLIAFVVQCLFIAQYLVLVAATPEYWWHIIIILVGGILACIVPLMEK